MRSLIGIAICEAIGSGCSEADGAAFMPGISGMFGMSCGRARADAIHKPAATAARVEGLIAALRDGDRSTAKVEVGEGRKVPATGRCRGSQRRPGPGGGWPQMALGQPNDRAWPGGR